MPLPTDPGDKGRRANWAEAMAQAGAEAQGRIMFWIVALIVGVASGYAAIGFRLAIDLMQTALYGADNRSIHTKAAALDPLLVFIIPVIGGLVVGLILWRFTPQQRVLSVADVIAAAAMRDARVNKKAGLASAAASLVTLSTGGSTGREGPVVHLSAVIASWVDDRIDIHGVDARDILGCAAAAAVSASFNAPIAGALFALEVVLRHYALHAFGPIVVASVAGAVISRVHMGEIAQFALPPNSLAFYEEAPAFLILGLVCGLVAVILMRALFFAEDVGDRIEEKTGMPPWLRPTVAGAMLGLVAIQFPHVIGVGYETTSRALTGQLPLALAIGFAVVKGFAVCVTYGGRMGGGVFSPSLMMGALTGLAFGDIAMAVFPDVSGSEGLYALAGMGAVSAAVLGAPISTTLIVFELTGDYQAAIAVMLAVSLATVVSNRFVWKSFFLSQLMRGGVILARGVRNYVPSQIQVGEAMRRPGALDPAVEARLGPLIEEGVSLTLDMTLAEALRLFAEHDEEALPVLDEAGELAGALYQLDAMKPVYRALVDAERETEG